MFAYRFLLKTQNITTTPPPPLSYKIKRNHVRGFVTVFQNSAERVIGTEGFLSYT